MGSVQPEHKSAFRKERKKSPSYRADGSEVKRQRDIVSNWLPAAVGRTLHTQPYQPEPPAPPLPEQLTFIQHRPNAGDLTSVISSEAHTLL